MAARLASLPACGEGVEDGHLHADLKHGNGKAFVNVSSMR
jgi:hypothetical protein